MQLKRLQLEHFRNYEALDLSLDQALTALVGLNAQGKTNILESLVFLALGKSFRSSRALDALKWGRPHGRIKAEFEKEGGCLNLELFFQRQPEQKKMKQEDKILPPREFLGQVRVVLFTPDHLELATGSPNARRQFLDRLLLQMDSFYLEAFSTYQRTLSQRNALLKRIQLGQARENELNLWDEKLISAARDLWLPRARVLHEIKGKLPALYSQLAGQEAKLTLCQNTHQERFDERLVAARDRDLSTGSTSVGPHRDDFGLMLDKKDLSKTGSRGECRSAVLALKLAEIQVMEEVTQEKPLLLLDDVFSELDEQRQAHLASVLQNYQTILTTTSKDYLRSFDRIRIFEIQNGTVREGPKLVFSTTTLKEEG